MTALLDGAPVVLLPSSIGILHLPAPVKTIHNSRRVELVDVVDAPPGSWPTQCGLHGDVFIFGELLRRRAICTGCSEAS